MACSKRSGSSPAEPTSAAEAGSDDRTVMDVWLTRSGHERRTARPLAKCETDGRVITKWTRAHEAEYRRAHEVLVDDARDAACRCARAALTTRKRRSRHRVTVDPDMTRSLSARAALVRSRHFSLDDCASSRASWHAVLLRLFVTCEGNRTRKEPGRMPQTRESDP